jgi:hypothetical protein
MHTAHVTEAREVEGQQIIPHSEAGRRLVWEKPSRRVASDPPLNQVVARTKEVGLRGNFSNAGGYQWCADNPWHQEPLFSR